MMELETDFPIGFDNTMRVASDACLRKFQFSHIYNLRKSDPSIHLTAGAAYAKGLEVMRLEYFGGNTNRTSYIGKGLIAAIREWDLHLDDPMLDSPKSLYNVLCALVFYMDEYKFEYDWLRPIMDGDKPRVEFTFALPLAHNNPNTGEPLLYTGRFDQFVEYSGAPAVFDDKTATQLGASWIAGWELDSQMTGYIYAAREHGLETSTAIIRGTSFLKTSFGKAQAIVYRTEYEIRQWRDTLDANLDRLLETYESWDLESLWQPSLGQACKAYGGCPFVSLCRKENWREWVEPEFQVFKWDPLEFQD